MYPPYIDSDRIMLADLEGASPCIRSFGHSEEHLVVRSDGSYFAFESDSMCDCSFCKSPNPDDWCRPWWQVTKEDAQELLKIDMPVV